MRLRFKTGVIIIIIIQHLVLSLNIFSYKNNIKIRFNMHYVDI